MEFSLSHIDFASFYNFPIGFWKCFSNVIFFYLIFPMLKINKVASNF